MDLKKKIKFEVDTWLQEVKKEFLVIIFLDLWEIGEIMKFHWSQVALMGENEVQISGMEGRIGSIQERDGNFYLRIFSRANCNQYTWCILTRKLAPLENFTEQEFFVEYTRIKLTKYLFINW